MHREPTRGHRQLEHTADLCIEAFGESEEIALAEAVRALVAFISEEAAIYRKHQTTIAVEGALDREDRMVRFLNEVLHAAQEQGFLACGAEVTLVGETALQATLFGERDARARVTQELKSVTYHDLSLARRDDGLVWARFVVDV